MFSWLYIQCHFTNWGSCCVVFNVIVEFSPNALLSPCWGQSMALYRTDCGCGRLGLTRSPRKHDYSYLTLCSIFTLLEMDLFEEAAPLYGMSYQAGRHLSSLMLPVRCHIDPPSLGQPPCSSIRVRERTTSYRWREDELWRVNTSPESSLPHPTADIIIACHTNPAGNFLFIWFKPKEKIARLGDDRMNHLQVGGETILDTKEESNQLFTLFQWLFIGPYTSRMKLHQILI